MKKVGENCATTWPRDIKRVIQNLNCSPIPSWKSTITPYELMFHRTPRIIARPSNPDLQSLTDHVQEMSEAQARAQDMCRELCVRTPNGQNPGLDLKQPEQISAGDFVLLRSDMIATNNINSILKLTRIYTRRAYRVISAEGNQFSVLVNNQIRIYHRKRLRKVSEGG